MKVPKIEEVPIKVIDGGKEKVTWSYAEAETAIHFAVTSARIREDISAVTVTIDVIEEEWEEE